MEAIALSPPVYSAKKRPLEFVSLNQANNEPSSWLDSSKRSRIAYGNDENSSPSRLDSMKYQDAELFKKYDPSMFASSSNPAPGLPPLNQSYQDTCINTIKLDYERKLQLKDEQLLSLTKISRQIHEANARLDHENKSLAEENKILKKAFGIQDSRMREVCSQNQQIRQMIDQMSEYIANLERINYQMREELRNRDIKSTGGNHTFFQPPNPPPDVY